MMIMEEDTPIIRREDTPTIHREDTPITIVVVMLHNNMFNGATLGSGLGNELNRSRDPFGVLLSNQDGGNNLPGTTSGSTILKDQSSSAHNLLNAQNGVGSNKQGGMGVTNILYEQFNSMKLLSPAITPPSSGNHSTIPIGSIGNHSTLPIGVVVNQWDP